MQRKILMAALATIGLVVVGLVFWWLWGVLASYVEPETATDRKDLVNIFVFIAAGAVGSLTALAAVGNLYISRRHLENARENLRVQRELEDRRAQEQRNRDNRRANDEALQAYFRQIGDLLTEHQLKEAKPKDAVSLLARAQTLTVLGRLDAGRKRFASLPI